MANNITMIDVFRSMHSMNVEHVRQLFVNDFKLIINQKDEKIRSLETHVCDINSNCNIKCTNCAKLEHEMQIKTKEYDSAVNCWQIKANGDKECIDKLNKRIQYFNGMLNWVNWAKDQLNNWKQQYDAIVEQKNKSEFDNKNLVESLEKSVKELRHLKRKNAKQNGTTMDVEPETHNSELIYEKHEIIHDLQTQLCDSNSTSDLKCKFCANLEQELQNSSKIYNDIINRWQMKANKDKECIDKLNARIDYFNSMWNQMNSWQHQYNMVLEQKNNLVIENKNLVESLERSKNVEELERLKAENVNLRIAHYKHISEAIISNSNNETENNTEKSESLEKNVKELETQKKKLECNNRKLVQSLAKCREELKHLRTENVNLRVTVQQKHISDEIISNSKNDTENNTENGENIVMNNNNIYRNEVNKTSNCAPNEINSVSDIESDVNANKEISIRSEIETQTEKSVNKSYKVFFVNLLSRLEEKDTNNLFGEPVNNDVVKDYLQIIKNPMDFRTISLNIMNNKYLTYEAFETDFELIIKNCIYYYDKETVYYKSAIKLRHKTTKILKEWRKQFELYDRNTGLHNPRYFDDINIGQRITSVTEDQTLKSKPEQLDADSTEDILESDSTSANKSSILMQILTKNNSNNKSDVEQCSSLPQTDNSTNTNPYNKTSDTPIQKRSNSNEISNLYTNNKKRKITDTLLKNTFPKPIDSNSAEFNALNVNSDETIAKPSQNYDQSQPQLIIPKTSTVESLPTIISQKTDDSITIERTSDGKTFDTSDSDSNELGPHLNTNLTDTSLEAIAHSLLSLSTTIPKLNDSSSDALNASTVNLTETIALQNETQLLPNLIIPETAESLPTTVSQKTDDCLDGTQTSGEKSSKNSVNSAVDCDISNEALDSQSSVVYSKLSDTTTSSHTTNAKSLESSGSKLNRNGLLKKPFLWIDFKYPLKHNDVVWAKCVGYPWYPAVIINPDTSETSTNGEIVYFIPSKDVLEKRPTIDDNLYLVMFFDAKHTWQWLPRNKLYPLNTYDIENIKLVDKKKYNKNERSVVRKAYKSALEFVDVLKKINGHNGE